MSGRPVGQPVFEGVGGYLGTRAQVEFDQDPSHVILNSLRSEEQLVSDLAVRESARDAIHHVTFARRERIALHREQSQGTAARRHRRGHQRDPQELGLGPHDRPPITDVRGARCALEQHEPGIGDARDDPLHAPRWQER